MAFSSWLGFGKKKPNPEADVSSDNKPATNADEDDEFLVIERKPQPRDNMYPSFGPGGSVTLPYQVYPSVPGATGAIGHPSRSDSHPCNPLDDVPFKLNSLLVGGTSEWTRNDAAHFKSVLSRAVHQNETVYKYDFSHEESIMRESHQSSVGIR